MNSGLDNIIMNMKIRKNNNNEMDCQINDVTDRELLEISNETIEINTNSSNLTEIAKLIRCYNPERGIHIKTIKAQIKEANTIKKKTFG